MYDLPGQMSLLHAPLTVNYRYSLVHPWPAELNPNLDQPPFSVCPRYLVVFYLLVGKLLEKGAQVLLKIRRAIFPLKHRSSYFICLSLLCLPGFNPFAGIYKSFQPWRYLVLSACRVVRPVPLKYRTFNVRHCNQMTSGAVTHHRRIEA